MKIHDCIKKAGKALGKPDRQLVLDLLPDKVKELGEQAGSESALTDVISDLKMERSAMVLDVEDQGVEVPPTEAEVDEQERQEELIEYEALLAQKEKTEKEWTDSIDENLINEERMVEPANVGEKKILEWDSHADAKSYARAYGIDQAEVMEVFNTATGKYQLRYKTNKKNKRYLNIKDGHGFITLAARDRIWTDQRAMIADSPRIGGGKMILSLFDRTGTWSQPYVDAGYDVVQIDVDHPLWAMDILDLNADMFIEYGWEDVHGILAAPPCQHFSNACRGLWKIKDKDGRTRQGLELLDHMGAMVEWLLPDFHSIENPSQSRINRPADFTKDENLDLSTVEWLGEHELQFNPNKYGDNYTKNTKLWGRFNSELPTANVFPAQGSRIWKLTGYTKKQKQERSITPVGFSQAFFMANSPLSEKFVDMKEWMGEWPFLDEVLDNLGSWNDALDFVHGQVNKGRTLAQLSEMTFDMDALHAAEGKWEDAFDVEVERQLKEVNVVEALEEQNERLKEKVAEQEKPTKERVGDYGKKQPFIVGSEWAGAQLLEELGERTYRKKLQKGLLAKYPADHHTNYNGQGPYFVAWEKAMATNMHQTREGAIAEFNEMYPEPAPTLDLTPEPTATEAAVTERKITEAEREEVPVEAGAGDLFAGERPDMFPTETEQQRAIREGKTPAEVTAKWMEEYAPPELTEDQKDSTIIFQNNQLDKMELDHGREFAEESARKMLAGITIGPGFNTADKTSETALKAFHRHAVIKAWLGGEPMTPEWKQEDGTPIATEQVEQTPEQELAEIQTEYDRVTIERSLPFPEQRKIAEESGSEYRDYRDLTLADQQRRRRRILVLQDKIDGKTDRLTLEGEQEAGLAAEVELDYAKRENYMEEGVTEEDVQELLTEPVEDANIPDEGLSVGDEVSVAGETGVVIGVMGDSVQFRSHRLTNPNAFNTVPIEMVKYVSTPTNGKVAFSKAIDGLTEKGSIEWDQKRMMRLLGEKMYTYNLADVVVKELVQNSFDAAKGAINKGLITEGKIEIETNWRDRSVTLRDNAGGMDIKVVREAFFTVAGTAKPDLPIEERSGGLGLAKVGFMLNAEKITLRTTVKGSNKAIVVELTKEQVMTNQFDITYEDADIDEHGTEVVVTIPRKTIDSDGTEQTYTFPYSAESISFLNKPLIHDNIEVTYKEQGDEEVTVLPMGKNFDTSVDSKMPFLTTATFPDWGTADVYFGTDRIKTGSAQVLSAGVYQFTYYPKIRKGESIPFDIVINVKSKVKADSMNYPFTNSREDWTPRLEKDIELLNKYLARVALGEEAQTIQDNMGSIVSMPLLTQKEAKIAVKKRAAERAFKNQEEEALTPEQEAELAAFRKATAARRKAEAEILITDDVKNKAGETIVKSKKEVEKEAEEEAKALKEGRMTTDKDAPELGEFMNQMLQDPTMPLFHSNLDINLLEIGREHGNPEQFFAELGTTFMEMKNHVASESGIWSMDGLKPEELFFAGISIDKQYGGVHIKVPYKAVFLNPLYADWNDKTLYGSRSIMMGTMIHELAHQGAMSHGQSHNSVMTRITTFLEDSGMMDYFRDSVLKTLSRHQPVFEAMREAYDKSNVRNVGKSFSDYDESSESVSDGGVEGDTGDTRRTVQEREQPGDGRPVRPAIEGVSERIEPRGVFEERRDSLSDEQVEGILGEDPDYSIARTRADGITVKAAKAAVGKALGRKLAQRIGFYETLADIPEEAITSGRELLNTTGMLEGFVLGRKAFLITKNLSSEERAVWVAWHEMWHRGARVRYGAQFNRALRKAGSNNVVSRLAGAITLQRRKKDRWGHVEDISKMQSINEALAELSSVMRTGKYDHIKKQYNIIVPEGMRSGWRAAVQGWIDAIKHILNKTRAYLMDTAVGPDSDMTDLQVSNMVRGVKLDVSSDVISPDFSLTPEEAKFERQEVEDRWVESGKGYTPITMKQWVMDHVEDVKQGFSRHYINLPTTEQFAEVTEQLRKVEAAPEAARDSVIRMMKIVTQNMTAKDLDLFTRKIVLDDLSYEITQEHDLPMDLTPDEVYDTLARIDALLENRPDIMEAVETRRILVQSIAARLVEGGVLTENEIKNPYYYRHQILDYMQANDRFGSGKGAVRTPKRAGRKGSLKDINVNYLEVEFEWLNKALIDIETATGLSWVKNSVHNVREDAVAAGREANIANFTAILDADLATNGYEVMSADGERVLRITSPLNEESKTYTRRIAMGMKEIQDGIENRTFDIPERYADIADELLNDTRAQNPMFYEFIGWLADNGQEGSMGAKMVFAAINQRKAWKRSLLGEKYVNTQSMDELVYKGYAPEGYVTWQPDKGRLLYTAHTLSDHVVSAMVKKMAEGAEGLTAADAQFMTESVRNMLAVGGPKYQMIIPSELAATLDSLHDEHMSSMIGQAARTALTQWKRWQLVSPWRFLKYNINNFSGDIDAVIAIGPGILKYFPKAVAELTRVMYKGATPSAKFNEAVRRGVFASGLSVQEIKQIDEMAEFRNLLHKGEIDLSVAGAKELVRRIKDIPLSAFRGMQKATWYRENMMRYAAYLYYENLLASGHELTPMEYGASRPEILDELTDHKDKAAMLARKTVGDYGDISHYGATMRQKVYPFWSWVEVNTKRYWRLADNAMTHNLMAGLKSGTLTGAALGIRATTFLGLRTMAMYSTIYLWNNLMFGDEEEELTTDARARLHINIGRDSDGRVRTIRFQGALSDFLDWVGFGDVSDTIMEVEKGRATYKDVLEAAAVAPVNKFVGGLTPVIKVPVELIRGESWWPDVFHPRRIRDKWRYAAQIWAMEHEYDLLFNKPSRGYAASLSQIAWRKTDPGEASYSQIRSAAYEWRERNTGKTGSSSFTTPRSEALYEYKLAQKYDDKEAKLAAKKKIIELSKSKGDALKAIRGYREKSKPLAMLNKKETRDFKKTLDAREKDKLKKALRWWKETFR